MKKKKTNKIKIPEKTENFLNTHSNIILISLLLISVYIFYKLFDIRVNLNGDDSEYIFRAYKFLKDGIFPTWQGPFYPIVLSGIIGIFGLSVPIMKIFSAIFLLLAYFIYFLAFKSKIRTTLLIAILIIVGLNAHLAYYSAFTFAEAIYILLQSVFLFISFKFINTESPKISDYIFVGLITITLYLTRTVGIAGLGTLLFFLLVTKKWEKALFLLLSFSVFYGIVYTLKKFVWNVSSSQFSSQLTTLIQKHPYNAAMGKENFSGFLQRFVDNSNLYLSEHIFRFAGLREMSANTIQPMLTILIYLLVIVSLIFIIKKNKYLTFAILYFGAFIVITFFSLQKFWNQDRLILPMYPILVTIILSGFYYASEKIKLLKSILVILCIVLTGTTISRTNQRIEANKNIHKASMEGDIFYGFTPDWTNYMKMSEYTSTLEDSTIIACRKPGISFIYGRKEFVGISMVPTTTADSLFQADKIYYAIPLNDNNARYFKRNQIAGIFYGVSTNSNFKSNTYHYLFETNAKVQSIPEQNLINIDLIQNAFESLSLFSPDQLLTRLKNQSVDFIISANLRSNPTKKTDKTITTVPRYIQIITMKYPQTFRKKHEIGDDEIATLYQIYYPN